MRGTELILALAFLLLGCYSSYPDTAGLPLDDSSTSPDPRVDPAFEPRPDPTTEVHVDAPDPCSPSRACEDIECGWNEECDVDCGPCRTGRECIEGRCIACAHGCGGRSCGVDTCGNPYGSCPDGQICDQEGTCVDASYLEPCSHILEESLFCLTKYWAMRRLALIGIDSGTVCILPLESAHFDHAAPDDSIAWIGEYLYVCGGYPSPEWGVVRISLRDASAEVAAMDCEAVARYGDGLLVMSAPGPYNVAYYESFEDAQAGDGTRVDAFSHASRMTAFCETAYTAWHSTDEVDTFSLPVGSFIRTIHLEDYDGWVWGMSVTEDGRLLLINEPEERLAIFDVSTGESLGNISPGHGYHGLACATNP